MNSKITFLQLLSLLLVGCLVSVRCNRPEKPVALIVYTPFSERIKPGDATDLHTYYDQHNVLTTINILRNPVYLEKFSFTASQMQDILTNNASFPNPRGKGDTLDKIVLNFGIENFTGNKRRWHAIAYGMKNAILLDTVYNSGDDGTIYDDDEVTTAKASIIKGEGLRGVYKRKSNVLMTIDKNHKQIPLEGLSFDAWQIQEILTNNASGVTPDKVVFYLGLELEATTQKYRWHLIAYGMKGSKLLNCSTTYSPTKSSSKLARAPSIFDKADPCPPCY